MWILAIVAVLGVLVALAVWVGGRAIESTLANLRREAESLGLSLTMPTRERDAEAERHRATLREFEKTERLLNLGRSSSTEDPQELEAVMAKLTKILPTVYALSECGSSGNEERPFFRDVLAAVIFLTPDANQAIVEKDLDRLLRASAAIRKLAHLLPPEDTISSGTISIVARVYCGLLQRGAEAFLTPKEIDAIADEARLWEILSFDVAAEHMAAERFETIDADAASAPPNATLTQRIDHAAWSTKGGIAKQKIFVLREAIDIYPKWNDDGEFLKSTEPSLVTFSSVRHFARFLKVQELELRALLASLWATLHARRLVLQGRHWPTLEELAKLGVQAADPVTGTPYEWREFEGKQRLFGLQHATEGPPVAEFLLLSDAESQRARLNK